MISTHVLDTSKGHPAAGIAVRLEKRSGDRWNEVSKGLTNADGRHAFECEKLAGVYRIVFEIEPYFAGQESFFPVANVVFKIEDTGRKYHVPLLLNPFAYSTYRGS